MGGNSRRKIRRKRKLRDQRWDLIATKALLTTKDPADLYTPSGTYKAFTLLGIKPASENLRWFYGALCRAGIKAIPYSQRTILSPSLWSKSFMDFVKPELSVFAAAHSESKDDPTDLTCVTVQTPLTSICNLRK